MRTGWVAASTAMLVSRDRARAGSGGKSVNFAPAVVEWRG